MIKKIISVVIASTALAGCACPHTFSVDTLQSKDKQMSCKEVVFEINEVEFRRREAQESKTGSLDHVFNPLCYPSSYLSAQDAEKAATKRLDYLNQVYDLLGCGREEGGARAQQTPIPRVVQPQQQPRYQMPQQQYRQAPQQYRQPYPAYQQQQPAPQQYRRPYPVQVQPTQPVKDPVAVAPTIDDKDVDKLNLDALFEEDKKIINQPEPVMKNIETEK